MAEILVEENFVRIDGEDMNALLNILHRLGVEAEPTAPRSDDHSRNWVLRVHWLQTGAVDEETMGDLPGALAEIHAYFVAEGKLPPSRVVLHGSDDTVLHTFTPGSEQG
jgi:hypothetical protein